MDKTEALIVSYAILYLNPVISSYLNATDLVVPTASLEAIKS